MTGAPHLACFWRDVGFHRCPPATLSWQRVFHEGLATSTLRGRGSWNPTSRQKQARCGAPIICYGTGREKCELVALADRRVWRFETAGLAPFLSSRAQPRDLLCAILLPQIFTELQRRTRRRTILSAGKQESHSWQRSGCYRDPRSSAHPMLELFKIPGRRKAHADPSTALLMNELESALDEVLNVPQSSQRGSNGGHPAPLAQPDRCVSHPVHPVLNLHCKQIPRDDKCGLTPGRVPRSPNPAYVG